ncbi:MAG: carboxypeptidase-like regulatory domain-containing protein, partial [Planctomycetota bacterium]
MHSSFAASALLLLAGPSLARDVEIPATILDVEGAPVAGAEIALTTQPPLPLSFERELLSHDVTDAEGRGTIVVPDDWIERRAVYRDLTVSVRAEGYALGCLDWPVEDVPVGHSITIRLHPPGSSDELRVLRADGEGFAGARVFPIQFHTDRGAQVTLPTAVWTKWAIAADESGVVRLPFDLDEVRMLGVEGEDGVTLQYQIDEIEPPLVLQLPELLERRLSFEGARPVGTAIRQETWTARTLPDGRKVFLGFHAYGTVEADERQRLFAPAGYGSLQLWSEDASALRYGAEAGSPTDRESVEPFVLSAQERTVRVRGRVVSDPGGEPVAGARVRLATSHSGSVVTGEDGRYEALVAATSMVRVQHVDPPTGYWPAPSPRVWSKIADDAEVVDLKDITLQRGREVSGGAVLADGAPAAHAWIVAEQDAPNGRGRLVERLATTTTDADGRFVLRGLAAGVDARVVVSTGRGTGRAVVGANERVLDLTLERGLAATGAVTGTDGVPVAGLELRVFSASPEGLSGGERLTPLGGAETFRTDEQGRFSSNAGLEPDQRYAILWRGAEATSGRSRWWTGAELASGVALDVDARRPVRGTLTGGDRIPLGGAQLVVRSTGETTRTDATGAFALDGVATSGDVVLVTTADGRSSSGVLAPSGDPVAWNLRPPVFGNLDRLRDLEGEREVARALLAERLDEELASGDDGRTLRAVERYAWVDPSGTLARVEKGLFEVPWQNDFTRSYVATALLETSPEEALAVAQRIERGMSHGLQVLAAAERLERDAELEQLALLRAKARAIDPPEHRVVVLARLGGRLLDLGQSDAADSVLTEAQALATKLPDEGWPAYARSVLGETLCRVDVEAGSRLIEATKETFEISRHRGNVAMLLAAEDPAAAEQFLDKNAGGRSGWPPRRFAGRVAYAMAPVDLQRARAIAERYDPSGHADGMIAEALLDAGGSHDEARASLERAFEKLESIDPKEEVRQRRTAAAASLLPVAARLDPVRLEAWVARVLALRPPVPPPDFRGDDARVAADGAIAWFLADLDPELGRALVGRALEAASGLD